MAGSSFFSKCLCAGLLSITLWLAHASWKLSLDQAKLELPPLQSSVNGPASILLVDTADVERQLDFMVWPRERMALLQRKLALTQSMLNLNPLDAERWVLMVRLQNQLNASLIDRNWALANALEIAGWNHRAHWDLIYACLTLAEVLSSQNDQRCNRLLTHSPLRNRPAWVALRLKLDEEWVVQQFERAARNP